MSRKDDDDDIDPSRTKKKADHDSRKSRWKPNYAYEVNYNDHFETPLNAYQDILPILDEVEPNGRNQHRIYDPYYCDGRTATYFRQLGFPNIIHEKRDFYNDIEQGTVPSFHTLVTNPPFSDQHKKRCLEFAFEQLRCHNRPFFLVMPNYVASREYYRTLLNEGNATDVVYIFPPESYQYDHPEGTGKVESPFDSLWFCGLGVDRAKQITTRWKNLNWEFPERQKPQLVTSLDQLQELKMIPSQKRPNPRQRRKKKTAMIDSIASSPHSNLMQNKGDRRAAQGTTTPERTENNSTKRKKSKYRDSTGSRKKKRF